MSMCSKKSIFVSVMIGTAVLSIMIILTVNLLWSANTNNIWKQKSNRLTTNHQGLDNNNMPTIDDYSSLSSEEFEQQVAVRQLQEVQQQQQQQQWQQDVQEERARASMESIEDLRERLPPSIWTTAGSNANPEVVKHVQRLLSVEDKMDAAKLCGKFLFSTLSRAVQVQGTGGEKETFVSTGDIDDMWVRDSAVQMGIYYGRIQEQPFLRYILEGAIRRQAFNILQDPYANSYSKKWRDPSNLNRHDQALGRGGFVATRNYELDSGAYYLTQLYDYYIMTAPTLQHHIYKPHQILDDPMIFDAVLLMINTWIVEQNHEEQSPYRYFELPRKGKGAKTAFTGMTWSGFRPSDDPCTYGYHVPANIFAAAALERTIELNHRIWHSDHLHQKATNLLQDIEYGIQNYGVMKVPKQESSSSWGQQLLRGVTATANSDVMESVYVYEVDGLGGGLVGFDDANVPSLLSIPLLGWSGYDKEIYKNTRDRILSKAANRYYFDGDVLKGVGSPHTPSGYVWPLGFSIQALTEEGKPEDVAKAVAFQILQSLVSACDDAMHESVSMNDGCKFRRFTREWFEWANAMFVVLVETGLGIRCDKIGKEFVMNQTLANVDAITNDKPGLLSAMDFIDKQYGGDTTKESKELADFKNSMRQFNNPYASNPRRGGYEMGDYYQGLSSQIKHDVSNNHNHNIPKGAPNQKAAQRIKPPTTSV